MFVLFVWVGMSLFKGSHRGVADSLCQGTEWQVAREEEGNTPYQDSPITVQLPGAQSLSQVNASPWTQENLGGASLVLGVRRAPPPPSHQPLAFTQWYGQIVPSVSPKTLILPCS